MRIAPAITLTGEQRKQLESWARGRSLPRRLGERAQMILLASEGRQNKEIARTLRRGRQGVRSEERRVGKECRARGARDEEKRRGEGGERGGGFEATRGGDKGRSTRA